MATSRIDITSDELINIKCGPCAEENRTRQADKYCLECKDYYCLPCTGMHKRFPALKGHKLLDKADFGSLALDGSLPSFSTQRCSLHPSKVVDMFCKEHDEVACASCIALNHRTCKTIFSIPENVDNLYKSTEMTNIKQKINRTKKAVEDIKKAKEQKAKELKQSFENQVKSIKAFRKELQTLLENAEQETIKDLKQHFDRVESCLTREIKEMNNLIDAMNELSTQLKKAEGNKAQEFVSMKISEKVTAQAEVVEKVQPGKTEESVSFTADQNIKSFLQEIQALGKVSSYQQSMIDSEDRLYKVKHQREIHIKLADDRLCSGVYGSCITEDGYLLLTDYGNKRLKRLDLSTETVKDYIDFQAGPYAVCLVSKTEAVVTLDNETVQFVSLGNKLSAARVLKIGHHCFGFAHKDGKLFISDYGTNVFIHDMNGQELKRISTDSSGKAIFLRTAHLTVSSSGDRVFVADYGKGVVVLDILGNHLSTPSYPTLSGIWGVCTDGKYLFAACSSGNCVQIGQDYKLMGELVMINNTISVCFDPHKTRLIVTHGKNSITVLDLE